jgi:hypothetical protein
VTFRVLLPLWIRVLIGTQRLGDGFCLPQLFGAST